MISKLVTFFKKSAPLSGYAANVTSQYGEDGLIAQIIKVTAPAEKYCVEFGAWDGKHFSNCHTLVTGAGWRGAMIEADPNKFAELQKTYAGHPVTCVNRLVDFEGANRLDAILAQAGVPQSFGLLSIDIDGNDYHVWESLKDFTPEIVVIEFNPTCPNDVMYVQDKSFDLNIGCSLFALTALAKEKGYELVATTTTNALFVRQEKYPLFGIANNHVAVMHTPLQDGRIFQGMDGSIHVVGMDNMVWKEGMPVSSADFQIFPKAMLFWGDAKRKK